jgi:hypothetical protein
MSIVVRNVATAVGIVAVAASASCTSSSTPEAHDPLPGVGGASAAGGAGSGGAAGAGAQPPAGAGTGGGLTAGSSGQGGNAGSVSTAGSSGAGLGGAAAGGAGADGLGAAGGAGIASGGVAGANGGMSGASGGGGLAGSAGIAGQGGAEDALEAARVLDGYQLLDPCDLTSYTVQPDPGAVCPQEDDVKNQHLTITFGGNAATTYEVTLRVRGVFEGYWYEGGTGVDGEAFYVGGVPTVGGFSSACKNNTNQLPFALPPEVTPTDDCFNGFNVVAMTVSAPKKAYYLNRTEDVDGDRPPHRVYTYDYTATIQIQGQASIDFYIIGSDEHQCYNHNTIIDGVELPSSPYIGDFFQFDVMSARVAP